MEGAAAQMKYVLLHNALKNRSPFFFEDTHNSRKCSFCEPLVLKDKAHGSNRLAICCLPQGALAKAWLECGLSSG